MGRGAAGRVADRLGSRAARAEIQKSQAPLSPQVKLEAKAAYLSGRFPSFVALARHIGISSATLSSWRYEGKWDDEKRDVQEFAQVRVRESMEDLVESMHVRHLEAAKVMQDKAMLALEEIEVEDISQARQLMESGVKLERQALGMENNITSANFFSGALPTTVDEARERDLAAAREVLRRRYGPGSEESNVH